MPHPYGPNHPGPGHDLDAIDERCRALDNASKGIGAAPRSDEEQRLHGLCDQFADITRRIGDLFGSESPECEVSRKLLLMLQHDLAMMSGPVPYVVEPLPSDS